MAGRDDDIDTYGKGEAFDRLQFGYSPAVAAEAVAFHSMTSTSKWIKRRKENYKAAILKKQKLSALHFEPITSMFALKEHWRQVAEFQTNSKQAVNPDDAEAFLNFLAAQRDPQHKAVAAPVQEIETAPVAAATPSLKPKKTRKSATPVSTPKLAAQDVAGKKSRKRAREIEEEL